MRIGEMTQRRGQMATVFDTKSVNKIFFKRPCTDVL